MRWRVIEFVADPAWAAQGPQAETSQFVRLPPEEAEQGSSWYVFSLELTPPAAPAVPIALNPLAPPPAPVASPAAVWQPKWILNRAPEMLRVPTVPIRLAAGGPERSFEEGLRWAMELLMPSRPAVPEWRQGILMLGREPENPRLWLGLACS